MTHIISNIAHLCNGCAIAFFLLSALKTHQECCDSYIRRKLSNILFFVFLLQLKDVVFLNEDWWYSDYISGIVKTVDMLLVPVMFIFFKSCVRPHGLKESEKGLYLFGNIIFIILYIVFPSINMYGLAMIYSLSLGLYAYITLWRECKKKEKHIENNYSYVEDISPQWVMKCLTALLICLICWELIFFWEDTWLGDAIFYLLTIFIWSYIQRETMGKREIKDWQGKFKKNGEVEGGMDGEGTQVGCGEGMQAESGELDKSAQNKELKEKLDRLMTEEQIYLNPHLNISDLAKALGTNRTYLSSCMNNELGKTFYVYINELRLDYAISLMAVNNSEECLNDDRAYSLKEIAEKSGFNSISTFNRQFHARYRMSPSTWMQKNV